MDPKTLPTHPFTGLTAIGFTSRGPVWPVVGGSQPVGGGDETDAEDDDAEESEDSEEAGEETEEPAVDWETRFNELQAQHEATQANLVRARQQAKKLREQAKAGTPATPPVPVPTPPAARTAARQQPVPEPQVVTVQDDAEIGRLQTAAVRAYAKAALLAAGCDADLVDAPLSKLKAAEIDWDEDDDEPILDDYIEDMKQRYGKAFAKPEAPVASAARTASVRRAGSIDQGAGTGSGPGRPAPKEMSFGEKLWQSGGGDVRAPRRPR